jgi:hypothetical protein
MCISVYAVGHPGLNCSVYVKSISVDAVGHPGLNCSVYVICISVDAVGCPGLNGAYGVLANLCSYSVMVHSVC